MAPRPGGESMRSMEPAHRPRPVVPPPATKSNPPCYHAAALRLGLGAGRRGGTDEAAPPSPRRGRGPRRRGRERPSGTSRLVKRSGVRSRADRHRQQPSPARACPLTQRTRIYMYSINFSPPTRSIPCGQAQSHRRQPSHRIAQRMCLFSTPTRSFLKNPLGFFNN